MDGKKLQRQYRDSLSDFQEWEHKDHATDYLLFPENIGPKLSIDETALSKGELYTIVTNKFSKGKKGSLVAIFSGTKVEPIINHLLTISPKIRSKVKEVTLDMANSMKSIITKCFSNAVQVTDRFHVQKLVNEAVQDIRIQERWKALDTENTQILEAKKKGQQFIPIEFDNGDTAKQLLIRSRYLLTRDSSKWTTNQKQRADILFQQYPVLKQAYSLSQQLRTIYNLTTVKEVGYTKLARWYNDVQNTGLKQFSTVINTIQINYKTILNYFDNRSTNASAESFNAKIKAFRAQFRGVRNIDFFLYRLAKLYA
ncbi:ISAon1 family transposase [Myroides marinus]|uniref:ISAon1 family transposase n=1 Tax=Myroides marinus TaxID=703342 RepID=UPI0025770E10|nr:transposase [Myroides marinus]